MIRGLGLCFLIIACVSAQDRECYGTDGRTEMDDWCQLNCNFVPANCPVEDCQCADSDEPSANNCYGANSAVFDDWCNLNCNYDPPYCPEAYCACGEQGEEETEPELPCRSVTRFLSDEWCTTMCSFTPPFCPGSYCTCDDGSVAATAVNITGYQPSCCEEPVEMYYIDGGDVYHQTLDFFTHEPVGDRVLCADMVGAYDIEIDEDRNLFVTDQIDGSIRRINPTCTFSNVVTQWPDGPIDAPTGLAIAQNGLYVSGHGGIYFIEVDEFFHAVNIVHLDWTDQFIDGIDMGPNGQVYWVERGAGVKAYNPATGNIWVYFDVNEHRIPDIKDVEVTDCGVYLSVTDSNQIWYCPDYMNGSMCWQWCENNFDQDGSSCYDMNNPFGLVVDCQCRVYSAQRGNGNILLHNYDDGEQTTFVVSSGNDHPTDVEIYINPVCSVTPTSSPSPSMSPDLPPTLEYCIHSDNPAAPLAADGDEITVVITASEMITAPTVMCNGKPATVDSVNGIDWIALWSVEDSDADGAVVCTITDFTDIDGMPTEPVDPAVLLPGCEATIDNTHPTADYCVESSNGNPDLAADGDILTVTVTTSEETTVPDVECNGVTFNLQSGQDGETEFVYTLSTPDSLADGPVTCLVNNYEDEAGNAGEDGEQTPGDECDVTVDNTHPTAEYCIKSDNENLASDGLTLTVDVTISEDSSAPSVMCGGVAFTLASGTAPGTEFSFTATTPDNLPDGDLTCVVNNYEDAAGNDGSDATQNQGEECEVTVDNTHPTTTYCAQSDNQDTDVAIDGNSITVTVDASEPVTPPDVSCSGIVFALESGDNPDTQFTYSGVTPDSLADGPITCVVNNYEDLALNAGEDGEQVLTPECEVVVDNTHPVADFCINAINVDFGATAGDTLLITVDTSEPTTVPNVECNGEVVVMTVGAIGDTFFSGEYAITEDTPEGPITCTCDQYSDLPGNEGEDGVQRNDPECSTVVFQTPSPSMTPSNTPTSSISESPTASISESSTSSISESPTASISESSTSSISESPTSSISESPTSSISESSTSSISESPTASISESSTSSISESPTSSISESPTSSISESPTSSISESPTASISESSTSSISESPTSSISESPTSSISESPTSSISDSPTASISESSTSSISESPTSSISESPTPSISESPTSSISESPSNTPSPTSEFSLAISIDDYNTECVVGDCGYSDALALQDAETTRKFGVNVYIYYRVSALDTNEQCLTTDDFQGSDFTVRCQRLVDPSEYLTPFNGALMRLYFRPANGGLNNLGLPPVYVIAPAVFAPSTFPNASPNEIVAGQIDCVGFQGKTARIVWEDPLPCWDDPAFPIADGYITCVPKRPTNALNFVDFEDGSSNVQPPLAPYKEVLCPLQ